MQSDKQYKINIHFESYDEGTAILELFNNEGFVSQDLYRIVKDHSFEGDDDGCYYVVKYGKVNRIRNFEIPDLDEEKYRKLIELLNQHNIQWEEIK